MRILEYIDGATYNVAPFHGSYKPIQEINMVNGAVAVDTKEGKSYILELNNFLNFTDSMDHSLLCPMQARTNGVIINNIPRNLCPDEADSQCIHFPVEKVRIPIEFHGPILYLPIRYPSDSDINEFQWLTLTDPSKWSPYGSIGEDLHGDGWDCDIDYTISSMYQRVSKNVVISNIQQDQNNHNLGPEQLSRLWRISLNKAKDTIEVTRSKSIRTKEGQMSQRFQTNLYQRRYKRLWGVPLLDSILIPYSLRLSLHSVTHVDKYLRTASVSRSSTP